MRIAVRGTSLLLTKKIERERIMNMRSGILMGSLLFICSCGGTTPSEEPLREVTESTMDDNSFEEDLEFLKQHIEVVLLSDEQGSSMAAIVPGWQARIMTSTCDGMGGSSFGWINYDLIQSGETLPHINAYGGEDRFWMGPEGGQFSLFFKGGDPFDLEHWQTPAFLDTEPFEVVSVGKSEASFRRDVSISNYAGTEFELEINRTVRMIYPEKAGEILEGADLDGLNFVAFESENRVINSGAEAWKRDKGLFSIWILGMYMPSPGSTIIAPYKSGPGIEGVIVNDDYFGQVPPERLKIGEKALFFSADGDYRSKIGLNQERAGNMLGSWDSSRGVLTIVQFNKPEEAADYVNSMWEIQEEPFNGDVVNCYNDGVPAPGEDPLGPFYELETSSPALELGPGEEGVHFHRTFHFKGPREKLDAIALELLGAGLDEAESAFALE